MNESDMISSAKGNRALSLYRLPLMRGALALFLLLSSSGILYATAQNTRSAKYLAHQALESAALGLSFSAERELRSSGKNTGQSIRQIFSDRVVAYALIADQEGKILFHTNPALVGSHLAKSKIGEKMEPGTTSDRRITLGTGLPAYEFSYILRRPDRNAEFLRLVLHSTPADRIISWASRMWWTVGAVLAVLWAAGIFLERLFTRHFRLQQALENRRQLALIGQMTAVLAHEIRNALGSIKGYVQWMDEKTGTSDSTKPGLAQVLRGTERIESLVDELLLFSRDESYHIEALESEHLIREALARNCWDWKGNIEVHGEPGLRLRGNREKLHRVMINGIQNGIQSMGSSGTLSISTRLQGQWVEIRIEDEGPGIPEEEFPHLFTPFHTTKASGTGLGLAYSRKVVEGMGGRIELRNREKSKGAALILHLPRPGKEQ